MEISLTPFRIIRFIGPFFAAIVSLFPQPFRPGGGLSHDGADVIQGGIHRGFNDRFVMDVHHDLVPRRFQPAHGFHQDVASGGLDDVLHEFRAVGFDALPLLCAPTPS